MSQKRDIPVLNNANYLEVLQRNGLSVEEFWSKTLQKMIAIQQDEFVFTKLAKKERIPRKAGTKTWTTRRYLSLPVDLEKGKLVEGLAPEPMKVEGKTVSGTIKQYGAYIELTDVAEDIHFDDIMSIYQPELARHAAETIERDLIKAVEAEASVAFAGSATDIESVTSSDVLKFEDVRRAWLRMRNHLRKGHPLAGGKPIFVAHPNILQDLLDDEDIVAELIIKPGYDSKIIKSGTIAEYTVYGIYLMETNVLDPHLINGNHVYRSFLVGGDSFISLRLGSGDVKWYKTGGADSGNPLAQKTTLGYKLWTGGKVIDPMSINVIYSGSTFDDVLADFNMDPEARKARQSELDENTDIMIIKEPNVTTYAENDEVNMAGLLVGFEDAWGSTIILDDSEFTVEDVDTSTTGTKTVTVTASNGKTATFTITVA